MIRRNLRGPEDLQLIPSLLGGLFRRAISVTAEDTFDYASLVRASNDVKLAAWKKCRDHLGMYSNPDDRSAYVSGKSERQQYVAP
jgi:hypothetical protein